MHLSEKPTPESPKRLDAHKSRGQTWGARGRGGAMGGCARTGGCDGELGAHAEESNGDAINGEGCAHWRTWWRATHTPRGRCRTRLGAGSRRSPACTLSAPCEEDRGGLVRTQPGGCADRRWREGQQQGKVSARTVWETRGPGKKGAVRSRARLGRGPGTRSRWGKAEGDSGGSRGSRRQRVPAGRASAGRVRPGAALPTPSKCPVPHTRAPPTAAS